MCYKVKIEKGYSIAIEGIDGSGKRTLAEIIEKKFIEEIKSKNVEIISFPRHNEEFSGELVDKFLYDGLKFDENSAYREGLLYSIDRMVSLGRVRGNGKSKITEYQEGKILIFDRYLSSNFIHRCNNMKDKDLKDYIKTMKNIEFDIMGIPRPSLTFVLFVPPEVSRQNILKRGRETDENETLENLTKSYNSLERLCVLEDYVRIDCCKLNESGEYEMKSREEIAEAVWEVIKDDWLFKLYKTRNVM